MAFFAGIIFGVVLGTAGYRYFYTMERSRSEVECNSGKKEKEIQKQLERLIAYSNDL